MSPQADERPLRLFVAVDLPEDVRADLGRLQEDFRSRDLSDLRWVRPEGIHLTLKFLGETPAKRVTDIQSALAAATEGHIPFRLSLGAPGAFGNKRGPRVLWIDVTGDVERLRELQRSVEQAMTGLGFPPEERDFSPHLTLARVPQPPPSDTAGRVEEALGAVSPPRAEFEVREALLMRSTLGPGGATYDALAVFPLSLG